MAERKPEDIYASVERRQKQLEKQWLRDARRTVQIYEAEDTATSEGYDTAISTKTPFNILYSNTETLLPAVYNSTPRPEVARRYTGKKEVRILDMAVSQVAERVLEYSADTNDGEYQSYDEACQDAVLGALVPGQGQVRVRFKQEGQYQTVCYDSVDYDRFIWEYSRKWCHVPWIAFGHDLNKDDFLEQFPDMKNDPDFKKINWKERAESVQPPDPNASRDATKREPTLLVWEVWYAHERKICWVCEDFKKVFLKKTEDYPLDLTTRFPCPEPLKFVKRNSNLTPVPIYKLYAKQAQELNRITSRIDRVVNALRVRGAYNGQMTELEQILGQDCDNALVAVENAAMMDGQGFEKHIWLLPIEKLVIVLRELYVARDAIKQTIYEIMGIGDILRSATDPNETAKAQTIKNQWGTLRMKRIQKDTQKFCLSLFRITLEFAAALYTPLTFKQITQLELPMLAHKQAAQQQLQQMQSAPPQPGPDGQPIPPPQPSQEVVLAANLPAWEEVLGILGDKFERTYRIDVETNSTVDLEATEDKAAIGEFMNAFGQMAAGLQPLVESGVLPFEASKTIMQEVFRRFRFGRRVEGALEMMQQPPPPEDDKAKEELHKAQMMKIQADAAKAIETSERKVLEMQETVTEVTGEKERLKLQLERASLEKTAIQASSAVQQKQIAADGAAKLRDRDDKLRQQGDQHRQELGALEQRTQKAELELRADKIINPQIKALDDKLSETRVAQAETSNQASQQMLAGVKDLQQRNEEMIRELLERNNALETAIQQLIKITSRPRKATITKDAEGNVLGGISELV